MRFVIPILNYMVPDMSELEKQCFESVMRKTLEKHYLMPVLNKRTFRDNGDDLLNAISGELLTRVSITDNDIHRICENFKSAWPILVGVVSSNPKEDICLEFEPTNNKFILSLE